MSRLTNGVASLLAKGPWTSRLLGPPKCAVWDVTDDATVGIKVHPVQDRPFEVPGIVPLTKPEIRQQLEATLIPDLKPLTLVELEQGRYLERNIAVLDGRDRLLHDFTQTWEPGFPECHSCFASLKLPPVHKLSGRVLLLATPGRGQNYFHWLVEGSARLAAAQKIFGDLSGFDHYLISKPYREFHEDLLKRAGVNLDRLVDPNQVGGHVEADHLVAVSNVREHLYETTLAWLRQRIPEVFEDASTPQRKFFISRSDAHTRRMTNEDELFSRLESLDFEKVVLTGRTLLEQARLFRSAKMVVAPHGAGLANLVFCSAGTKVVELHFPEYCKGLYWRLADVLNLQYGAMMGSPAGEPSKKDMSLPIGPLLEMIHTMSE